MLRSLRDRAFQLLPVRYHYPLHALRYYVFTPAAEKQGWRDRTREILSSPDYPSIPRVPEAGEVHSGLLTMHNGIRVLANSYLGIPGQQMFRATGGIHEPQEEKVFAAVLPLLPAGATMLELGAYWGFYSLWFCQVVPQGKCFLVEGDPRNLDYGRKNFEINGADARFLHAYVGAGAGRAPDGTGMVSVDSLVRDHRLDRIELLHSDIQGHEFDMLQGAEESIRAGKVDYLFISTHSEELHTQCEAHVRERNFQVICSIRPKESYSVDGILVAAASGLPVPAGLQVAKKPAA